MKSKFFFGACVIFVVLQIPIYARGPSVYDPSVPAEQSSILVINQCAITKFDGKSTGSSMNALAGTKQIQIPAGQHSIQVHQKGGSATTETQNTVDISYNFLPGYIYVVHLTTLSQGSKLYIRGAPRPVGEVGQNELVPNPASPEATPVEGKWQYKKGNEFTFAGNEFIWFFGGKNKFRGIFFIEKETITLPLLFQYKNGKWVEDFGGIVTMNYSGQEIRWMNQVLQKQ